MYCEKCGTKLGKNSMFCTKCGNKVKEEETPTRNSNSIKRKLFILSIIVGIIFCLSSLLGFVELSITKKEIAGYDGSNERYKNIYDWNIQEYRDNYWDYLAHNNCTIIGDCYCAYVDNEEDCLNQLLNGNGKYTNINKGTLFLMKNRYILLVIGGVSFVGTWLFHEKKVRPNKKLKNNKED